MHFSEEISTLKQTIGEAAMKKRFPDVYGRCNREVPEKIITIRHLPSLIIARY
jgi:hypothetical protein